MIEVEHVNRELSWLAFNERVLQEAEDPSVPLLERIRFLGIFSNNQDEFFRVRVATIRRLSRLGKVGVKSLGGAEPEEVLEDIQTIVKQQHSRFDQVYVRLLTELQLENIHIINEKELNDSQGEFVNNYFQDKVRQRLFPIMLDEIKEFPQLRDTSIYLAIRLVGEDPKKVNYSLVEVPHPVLPRFLVLPSNDNKRYIMFLDDVIRYNLRNIYYIFNFDHAEAYTIKFTRDAELDIDNDVSLSFMVAVERSLKRRRIAEPVRLIYDSEMPSEMRDYLVKKMRLFNEEDSFIPGARYHNFKDFMDFHDFTDRPDLLYPAQSPLPHPHFVPKESLFSIIRKRDIMLHFPYHSYNYMLDFLNEAAINPKVTEIHMTLYRVARQSAIVGSLINAARNGIKVTVVMEIQARFDEEANIFWANSLQEEGVRVIFGVTRLKVHSKLCLVKRIEDKKTVYYSIIGTGNFNEVTSRVYTDLSLMTAKQTVTKEVKKVFDFFESNYDITKYKHLSVAPFYLRNRMDKLISKEIKHAAEGKKAFIFMKMNSLVDLAMIKKLYEASQAGVKIRLIVRGICSLIPQLKGISENIEVISVVDKYLEHPRIFAFGNNGKDEVYIGSADLMPRNLDYRVEVMVKIYDRLIKKQILDVLEIQWLDNVKARLVNIGSHQNIYKERKKGESQIRSQSAIYNYFKDYYEMESEKMAVSAKKSVSRVR